MTRHLVAIETFLNGRVDRRRDWIDGVTETGSMQTGIAFHRQLSNREFSIHKSDIYPRQSKRF